MRVIHAPEPIPKLEHNQKTVFLGGSIEMGKADDWQSAFANRLEDRDDLILLNPRRPDWDSSWVQDPTPGTKFHEQVTWELRAQEKATIIVYNFVADTISPITLLELGLFSDRETIVCCPKTYFRYGNVKVTCDRYGVKCVEKIEQLYELVEQF